MKHNTNIFKSSSILNDLVQAYFDYIDGEYHFENKPAKKNDTQSDHVENKVWDREPEPATIAGLAFFLGFNSRDEFDAYETSGKYAAVIKRARLRIETVYEKKLHQQAPTGAIFALKNLGWNEKIGTTKPADTVKTIKVRIIETGPQPASNEKEIIL
ncbi:MAG TPA: terminase small subunit [Mucilaginibacter sp.]|nr:terminase small subunit [Mucilaginibacter sp.]